MSRKRKRRLTKAEVKEIRLWFEQSSQNAKPTIRQIARRYGVNQPSVVKSLGGWKGIKRGKPIPPPKPVVGEKISLERGSPVEIEQYTANINPEDMKI